MEKNIELIVASIFIVLFVLMLLSLAINLLKEISNESKGQKRR